MRNLHRSAGDLFFVLAWTTGATAAVLAFEPSPLRVALVLPLVLLFPGYALLAVLFPRRLQDERARRNDGENTRPTLTHLERFALSVTSSLALVPALAFVLNFTPYGVRREPVLLAVSGLTAGLILAGYVARLSVPPGQRYRVPLGLHRMAVPYVSRRPESLSTPAPFKPATATQRLLNLVFVVGVVVVAASIGYAAVTPAGGQGPFTEFYLLTETDDGQFRAENLPHEFSQGESRSLYVAVGNHEGQPVEYAVVVRLDGNELDRFDVPVEAGETRRVERSITPDRTGDRLRLSFLLYRGDPPATPTPENAYREVHLWVTVQ